MDLRLRLLWALPGLTTALPFCEGISAQRRFGKRLLRSLRRFRFTAFLLICITGWVWQHLLILGHLGTWVDGMSMAKSWVVRTIKRLVVRSSGQI